MTAIDWAALRAPFPKRDLDVVGTAEKKNARKEVTAILWAVYVDARAIQARLDEVVGPENWKVTYVPGPNTKEADIMCLLELRIGDEWISKADGADAPKRETVKGGYSNAIKRAAVVWGIGRYLYHIKGEWLDVSVKSWDALDHVFPKMPDSAKVEEERGSQKPVNTPKQAPARNASAKPASAQEDAPERPGEEKPPPPWLTKLMSDMDRQSYGLMRVRAYLRIGEDDDWRMSAYAKLRELSPKDKPDDPTARAKFMKGLGETRNPEETHAE
jgi:hypothetical protein